MAPVLILSPPPDHPPLLHVSKTYVNYVGIMKHIKNNLNEGWDIRVFGWTQPPHPPPIYTMSQHCRLRSSLTSW